LSGSSDIACWNTSTACVPSPTFSSAWPSAAVRRGCAGMRFSASATIDTATCVGVALDREAARVEHELGVGRRGVDRGPEVARGGVERLRVPREPRAKLQRGRERRLLGEHRRVGFAARGGVAGLLRAQPRREALGQRARPLRGLRLARGTSARNAAKRVRPTARAARRPAAARGPRASRRDGPRAA
jgi:hypothetical protein